MTEQQRMNRRTFIGMLAAGAGASFLRADARSRERKRPNIVVMIPDDLGWADIGYHGSDIQTPNLDNLAKQSVRFDRHYVMPTCTPTRVGFLTGHYPSRYGVLSPAYGKIFNDDTVTLAQALRHCGYTTSLTGKWHMGSPPEYTPRRYGFDSSYGYFHGQIDPYTHYYKTGVRSWHRNDQYLDEKGHATDLITDEAVRIIESDHDKPFFLYVPYSVPHHPLDEPDEWTSRYEGRIKDASRRLFAASVTHMDHGIGRIIDALESKGLRENTLVVFVSDNGGQRSWHSDEQYKGRYADKPHTVLGDNKPLRGWKGDVYEGGIRVPALANWPGVLKPGRLATPVHIVDWMPTLCGLAGYVPQKDLRWDGRDIWPSVSQGTAPIEPPLFYWKTPNASAVRRGDWKLIVNRREQEAELYNVTADPYEERDMAGQQPDRVNDLRRVLAEVSAHDR
ncbi:MAG: sulfatase-like hydrolase/transferase [Planctomycetota bacterium]|jgi:arylsulfatase A-like enzyme